MKTFQTEVPKKDEPVFLLQATDPIAIELVREYSDRLHQKGQQSPDMEFRNKARIMSGKIAEFADLMQKYNE